MLAPLRIITLLSVGAFCAEAAFHSRTLTGLNVEEGERYERIKRAPGVTQVRLIALDEVRLTKSKVQLEFFNGLREDFGLEGGRDRDIWVGRSGNNFDRFIIRKIGGRYSGHILHRGKRYVLIPIVPGVSALSEMHGRYECGIGALEKRVLK